MKVIRRRLDKSQLVPANIRFFEGNIQVTFDFGVTWVNSPENDPRYGVQFLAPALEGEDARCDAAYRMTEIIRAQVDAALDAANAVGLATTIIGILTILIPINPIVALVTALAAALLVIGAIVLDEAFDEARYEAIQCIFYQNISPNGQVTAEQLEDILTEFETQFAGSIAADVCVSIVFVMGQNGLSNAGSLTGGGGDCEDCPLEWCNFFDFADSTSWEFSSFANPVSNGMDSAGWVSANSSGGTYLNIEWTFPATEVHSIGFLFGVSDGYTGVGSGTWITALVGGVDTMLGSLTNPPPGISNVSWIGTGTLENVTRIRLNSQINAEIVTHCYTATINGEGLNPEGGVTC